MTSPWSPPHWCINSAPRVRDSTAEDIPRCHWHTVANITQSGGRSFQSARTKRVANIIPSSYMSTLISELPHPHTRTSSCSSMYCVRVEARLVQGWYHSNSCQQVRQWCTAIVTHYDIAVPQRPRPGTSNRNVKISNTTLTTLMCSSFSNTCCSAS